MFEEPAVGREACQPEELNATLHFPSLKGVSLPRRSTPTQAGLGNKGLGLNQNRLLFDEIFFQPNLVGEGNGSSLEAALVMFIMHQRFANQADVETRVLHLPDLTGFKRK